MHSLENTRQSSSYRLKEGTLKFSFSKQTIRYESDVDSAEFDSYFCVRLGDTRYFNRFLRCKKSRHFKLKFGIPLSKFGIWNLDSGVWDSLVVPLTDSGLCWVHSGVSPIGSPDFRMWYIASFCFIMDSTEFERILSSFTHY